MEIDMSRDFILLQDNGDGTITSTMRVGSLIEAGGEELYVSVMEGNLLQNLVGTLDGMSEDEVQEALAKTIEVPSSPEGVSE